MHKYLSTQYPELEYLLWENKPFPYYAGTLPIDLVFPDIFRLIHQLLNTGDHGFRYQQNPLTLNIFPTRVLLFYLTL